MSILTQTNKRKIVRDYQPKEPPVIRAIRFDGYYHLWNQKQKEYLQDYYADCDSERLAQILNCDVKEVAIQAKRLHLQKSDKFKLWFISREEQTKKSSSMPGYHWESDAEMNERIEREKEEDAVLAMAIADTFDFCNKNEKQYLTHVMFQALQWNRDTSDKIILGNEHI